MSVLSSAAGTVANVIKGNKNQAMLIVEDWRNVDRAALAAGGAAGAAAALTSSGAPVSTPSVPSPAMLGSTIGSARAALLGDVTGAAALTAGSSPVKRYFEVQFNPSSLTLDAHVNHVSHQDTQNDQQTNSQATFSDAVVQPYVQLSVDLIFDHVNNYDAFMWDKVRLGVGGTVANVVNAAVNGKQTYTVQPEVEGLIATLREPKTRVISFVWGDFSFRGALQNVSAEYTMFSVSGRPIRAKVSLHLRQMLALVDQSQWVKEFDKAFTVPGALNGASGLAAKARAATNLLNISI